MDVTKLRSDKVADAQVKDLQKSQKGANAGIVQNANTSSSAAGIKQNIGSEKVNWSDNASFFTEGVQAAKSSPDVRSERVAELKAAIKNGTYKVDANAVADKMLKAAIEENKH